MKLKHRNGLRYHCENRKQRFNEITYVSVYYRQEKSKIVKLKNKKIHNNEEILFMTHVGNIVKVKSAVILLRKLPILNS